MSDCDAAPSLRERKKVATRDAIHATALRMMSGRDAHEVTVHEICAEVGVSTRTFFNYYPTKLAAAFDIVPAVISQAQRTQFLTAGGDPVEDALQVVAATVGLPGNHEQVRELLLRQPSLALEFAQQTSSQLTTLFPLLRERCGDLHRARLAFGVVVLVVGSAVMHPAPPGAPVLDQLLAALAVLRGVVAPAALGVCELGAAVPVPVT